MYIIIYVVLKQSIVYSISLKDSQLTIAVSYPLTKNTTVIGKGHLIIKLPFHSISVTFHVFTMVMGDTFKSNLEAIVSYLLEGLSQLQIDQH